MKDKNCDHGFHGTLSEAFSSRLRPTKCPKCSRNYSEEGFLEACAGLGILPSSIDPFMYGGKNEKIKTGERLKRISNGEKPEF